MRYIKDSVIRYDRRGTRKQKMKYRDTDEDVLGQQRQCTEISKARYRVTKEKVPGY